MDNSSRWELQSFEFPAALPREAATLPLYLYLPGSLGTSCHLHSFLRSRWRKGKSGAAPPCRPAQTLSCLRKVPDTASNASFFRLLVLPGWLALSHTCHDTAGLLWPFSGLSGLSLAVCTRRAQVAVLSRCY